MFPYAVRLSRRAVAARRRILASLLTASILVATLPFERFISLPFVPTAHAAAFTPGNLVIYRVGTGAAALTNAATPVFLDEYATSGGSAVQSIALPTTATVSGNRALTASGTATSEGLLTRSVDGQYLVMAGYNATSGTGSGTLTGSTSATINRVIGRVDGTGAVDTTTALTDAISGGNPRGATSTNGTDLWISGTSGGGGIRYAAFGATASTALSATPTNLRATNIFNGQLYISSQTGAFRLSTVGTGTPTTAGQTITNLPGYPTATTSPYGFFFADLNAGVPGVDTVYVADDNATSSGGIQKYSLVAGSWVANGSISSTAGLRGLTGVVSGSNVTLYATSPGNLLTLTDTTGYNTNITGTLTSIATAPANTAFRGVAFAPAAAESAPTVSSTTPANSATNVALNSDITINFSEDVTVSSNSFTINCGTSSTHTFALTGSGAAYTLNPDADFVNSEICTVTVVATEVADVDTSDPPDQMAANYVFSFSTVPAIDPAPTVASTTPVNGATGVALNSNISVTFSEPVVVTANAFTISCASSGSHTATVSTSDQTTFTLDPSPDFTGNELCTVTVVASEVTDADTNDPDDVMAANYVFTFTTAVPNVCGSTYTPIYTIQGSTATSSFHNSTVTTEGIVTGDFQGTGGLGGFYMQDPTVTGDPATSGDSNSNTSDGIFVVSETAVNVGDRVRVTGTVADSSATPSFNQTVITSVTLLSVCSIGNTLPPAVVIADLPTARTTGLGLERYEGMRVTFSQALIVTDNLDLGRFGELTVSSNSRLYIPTNSVDPNDNPASGTSTSGSSNVPAVTAQQTANNNNRIIIDDGSNLTNNSTPGLTPIPYLPACPNPSDPGTQCPTIRAGDTLNSNATGVLGFGFSNYRLQPTSTLTFTTTNPRPAAPASVGTTNLRVASFNVENYFLVFNGTSGDRGANNAAELTRQRDKLVAALVGLNADVIGLIELQKANGNAAAADLAAALSTQGIGTYAAVPDLATLNGTDTDIKNGIIYRTLDASNNPVVTTVGSSFTDTAAPAGAYSRDPLAQTFQLSSNGGKFTFVVNHFRSKSCPGSGGDADLGDGQACFNDRRRNQAMLVATFVNSIVTSTGDSDVLVVGDLNAYAQEDPVDVFRAAGLVEQIESFVAQAERYTFNFDGETGQLDHAFATSSLNTQATGATIWHINSDEPAIIDYDTDDSVDNSRKPDDRYETTPYRSADHDPLLIGFNLAAPPDTTAPTVSSIDDGDADNTVTAGDTLTYTVTFNEDIDASTVTAADFDNAGTSSITIGTITETSAGVFTVQVTPTTAGTLQLRIPSGADIRDTANNALVTPVTDDTTVTVNSADSTAPTVTSIDDGDADDTVDTGNTLTYTVTFDEDIDASTVTAADFDNAGTSSITIGTITETSAGVFTVQVTPTTVGTLQLRIPSGADIRDTSNNALVTPVTDDTTVTVNAADITAPTVTSIDDGDADNLVLNNTTLTYTVTFNEDINSSTVDASDFDNAGTATITIGTITETTPTSGIFTVQVTPTTGGTIILRIPTTATISDAAGNALDSDPAITDDNTVDVDATAPTATIDLATGQADPASTSPINFEVVFSELVTGFDSSDIQVGGTAGATTAVVTGSGATYNVAVSGMTTDGTVTISFNASAATDAAGNGNDAPTVIDNSVTYADPGAFTAFLVTKTADTNDGTCDADCSLREAITAANADPGPETITFAPDLTGTIILSSALPDLSTDMTISGPGAAVITVQRDGDPLTPQFRIFTVGVGATVEISGLTISGGNIAAPGGGIYNDGGILTVSNSVISNNTATTSIGTGGGIANFGGALKVSNSTISGNNAGCDGGGIASYSAISFEIEFSTISGNTSTLGGGGVYNQGGTLDMTHSTVNGNTANSEGGGGIYNVGTLNLTTSTISGNFSFDDGGGIYDNSGIATLTSVTITNNHADSNDDASGTGGGLYNNNSSPLLHNTIVAGNFKGSGLTIPATADDIQGTGPVDSNSAFNLIGTGGSGGMTSGAPNNNQVNVSNPGLNPLQSNGGSTQTHALIDGSPAIDAGDDNSATPTTDQRGFNRPVDIPSVSNVGDGSDIGSFETGNHAPVISAPGAQATNEDTALVFSFDNGNRISISDIDAGSNPVQVTLTVTNGTISLASIEDLTFSTGDGFDDTTMTFTGTVSDINAALNGLTYTPAPNFNGAASLQITTDDLGNTGAGGPQSDTTTVNITVNPVNDAPVANSDAYSVNENATLTVPAPGVLANDTDAENSTLSTVLISTTTHGTLTLNANGSFTYTPQAGFSGTDSFRYKANDGTVNGNTATVTITVNEGGTLAFSSATYNVNENDGSAIITITRTGGSAGTATILFATSNGTASASDYTPVSTTVTFNDGEVSKAVNITINDDALDEPSETVNLTLSNVTGSASLGAQSSAVLTIADNDAAPTVSINDVTVTEGNSGTVDATFTVTLSAASAQTVTVNYQTANGTATVANGDYQAAPSTTLTFNPGETTKTVTIKVNGDLFNEADEDFFVNLSGQTNSTIADASGRGVITNDDGTPTLSINDVTVTEGNSGTVNATFTVTLTVASGLPVSVNYQTADGTATAPSDYTAIPLTALNFAPGETQKTITVVVQGDTLVEANETFFVNLSGAVNAAVSDNQGLGTITNDDATAISLSAATYTISEDGLRAIIVVNRQGDLSQASRVDYRTTDPSGLNNCNQVTGNASSRCDYATTAGTLRFAAGEASKNIYIPIINDVYLDGTEVFTLTLSNPVGGQFGSFSTATITITDNDTAPAPNPIDNDAFFIRQLYIDILGREPEASGLAAWLAILNHCSVPTDCDRVAVARGFVRSPEFSDRGYFVYRAFRASLGRFARYEEFMIDTAKVSGFLNSQELEANKLAYIEEFMNRQEFKDIYDPTIGNPTAYVDTLIQRAGLSGHPRRAAWIAGLTNSTLTRAQVLRELMESAELYLKYLNEAFVVMNYFGFLRRNPDAAYLTWLNLFNQTMDDRVIINGFIFSLEYRLRFGPN